MIRSSFPVRRRTALAWAAAALVASASAPAQSVAQSADLRPLVGAWEGTMQRGVNTAEIRVWFDGRGGGRFQIVGVTSDRNPITDVRLADGEVSFALPSQPVQTFRGRLDGTTIRGTFEIIGRRSPFTLTKID